MFTYALQLPRECILPIAVSNMGAPAPRDQAGRTRRIPRARRAGAGRSRTRYAVARFLCARSN